MESILLYRGIDEKTKYDLSIVIPTYKRATYLVDAINSILKQKAPKFLKYEIIVVNNDPNDDMDEIVSKYRNTPISFYKNKENYGQVGNVNQGAILARGKYVSYLHDDDILLPNYLETIEKYLDYDYDCILPEYYDFYQNYKFDWKHNLLRFLSFISIFYREKLQKIDPDDYIKCFHNIYDVPTCGVIFKKVALQRFGMFKEERGAAWDYYNFRVLNRSHDIYILHECIGARRLYTGMTNTQKVQNDFNNDKMLLLDELKNYPFVNKYRDCISSKKPFIKYAKYRIVQDAYIYLHNLERSRPITRRKFHWLEKHYNL